MVRVVKESVDPIEICRCRGGVVALADDGRRALDPYFEAVFCIDPLEETLADPLAAHVAVCTIRRRLLSSRCA